jgi:hypothetical protein
MRIKRRKRDDSWPSVRYSVGEECEEFLAGHLMEYLAVTGRPVPSWAWLNRVAHARPDELMILAAGGFPTDPPAWREALVCLAREVLERAALDGVDEFQRRLLVPKELQLIGEPGGSTLSPSQLVARVLAGLEGTTL